MRLSEETRANFTAAVTYSFLREFAEYQEEL